MIPRPGPWDQQIAAASETPSRSYHLLINENYCAGPKKMLIFESNFHFPSGARERWSWSGPVLDRGGSSSVYAQTYKKYA